MTLTCRERLKVMFEEKRASFDLEILSARGFEELQAAIYLHLDTLLEDLFSLIPEQD